MIGVPEFAEYSTPIERHPRLAAPALVLRAATHDDLDAVAAIGARREGVGLAPYREGLERRFGAADDELWVAVFESNVIGFGRSALLRPPAGAPPNCIPEGWYLGGLVVSPEFRRRGVGHELTRHRVERLFERVDRVCYFATAINRPTIDLHARLGFREIARDIWAPGASFTGGVGLLFELTREEWRTRRG